MGEISAELDEYSAGFVENSAGLGEISSEMSENSAEMGDIGSEIGKFSAEVSEISDEMSSMKLAPNGKNDAKNAYINKFQYIVDPLQYLNDKEPLGATSPNICCNIFAHVSCLSDLTWPCTLCVSEMNRD